jgi:hypothetical protein
MEFPLPAMSSTREVRCAPDGTRILEKNSFLNFAQDVPERPLGFCRCRSEPNICKLSQAEQSETVAGTDKVDRVSDDHVDVPLTPEGGDSEISAQAKTFGSGEKEGSLPSQGMSLENSARMQGGERETHYILESEKS